MMKIFLVVAFIGTLYSCQKSGTMPKSGNMELIVCHMVGNQQLATGKSSQIANNYAQVFFHAATVNE